MKKLEIKKEEKKIFLYYSPDETEWLKDRLDEYKLKNTFLVSKDKTEFLKNKVKIELANLMGDYYLFDKKILDINYDLFFYKDIELNLNYFFQNNYHNAVSIFKEIEKLNDNNQKIYIGGIQDTSIPIEIFKEMVKKFPNSYELQRYKYARIEFLIGEYFSNEKSYAEKYQKYLQKKDKQKIETVLSGVNIKLDLERVDFFRKSLDEFLKKPIGKSEKNWQKLILEIIKFLYPKYILVLEELEVKDPYYNNEGKAKTNKRKIDLALLDIDGTIDVIEIKVPEVKILSTGEYRNNFYPLKELSATILQLEKYIFYLNKGGVGIEKEIEKKYKKYLPKSFNVKITNPQGIIIAGRNNIWTDRQKRDFEIIKREYKNLIDILTYDDLLYRLNNLYNILK